MRGYLDLMKLRVVELLLVTTVPAMVLAAKGLPSFSLTVITIFAGTLAAGSANAFNMVIESDIDKLMARTAKRPIVTGVISKQNAAIFASVVGIISIILFWWLTTPLAALLALVAIGFYVIVYTVGLKRRTSQNIVWGGAAGCMPVLIGWAAVTNSLSITALAFFLVIFFWTPPHFWALAVRYKDDYAAAGIPMLPVVAPIRSVITQMWFHSLAMVVVSLLVIRSAGLSNWLFVITLLLIVGWKRQLIKLTKQPSEVNAGKLFQASIIFLSIYSFLLVLGVLLK